MTDKWWEPQTSENVRQIFDVLESEGSITDSKSTIRVLLEKPWRYDDEWMGLKKAKEECGKIKGAIFEDGDCIIPLNLLEERNMSCENDLNGFKRTHLPWLKFKQPICGVDWRSFWDKDTPYGFLEGEQRKKLESLFRG